MEIVVEIQGPQVLKSTQSINKYWDTKNFETLEGSLRLMLRRTLGKDMSGEPLVCLYRSLAERSGLDCRVAKKSWEDHRKL